LTIEPVAPLGAARIKASKHANMKELRFDAAGGGVLAMHLIQSERSFF
jgi:hypothetical protein